MVKTVVMQIQLIKGRALLVKEEQIHSSLKKTAQLIINFEDDAIFSPINSYSDSFDDLIEFILYFLELLLINFLSCCQMLLLSLLIISLGNDSFNTLGLLLLECEESQKILLHIHLIPHIAQVKALIQRALSILIKSQTQETLDLSKNLMNLLSLIENLLELPWIF